MMKKMIWKNCKFTAIIVLSLALFSGCDTAEDKKGRFLLKGNEKLKENDLKGAIEFYNEALNIDNEFADALYNRGIVYQKLNRLDESVKDYDRLEEHTSELQSRRF